VAVAVRFEHVSKEFMLRRTNNFKELLLGVSGHRSKPVVVPAVTDLHLDIEVGESVALLGHNGSGKSTSLKMLAGTVAPTAGRIFARGRIAPLLELGAGFHPDLTGRENVFLNAAILGIDRRETERRFDEIVDFAEVTDAIDTPVRFYSSGMVVRLGFAIAVNVRPEILLVDEVLAVGDVQFQDKCFQRMNELKRDGRTVVLVTHSLSQAEAFCDRAVVLAHGHVTYDGGIGGAPSAYALSTRQDASGSSE
jgi:ABC-2 type transport system ATP-binding protein